MYETGELAQLLGVEQPDEDEAPAAPEVEAPQSAPLGLENRLS
jgi:monothiol glutaredoxin